MTPSRTTGAPAGSLARLGAALGASLALHAVALEVLTHAPRGSRNGEWSLNQAGTARLSATLRAAAAGIESSRHEPPPAPPAPVQAPEVLEPPIFDPRPVPREAEPLRAELPGAGVLAAPHYFDASQLDQRPLIKTQVEPEFPSGVTPVRGRVRLRLYVSALGEVEDVAIVEAEPPGIFDKSALDAFSAARFTPGMKNGVPVRTMLTIEVMFGEPAPVQSAPRY